MLRIIQDLWTQVGPFFNSLFEDRSYLAEANDGHRKIIAAIRSGDPAAVRDAVVWDIGEAAESLMQRLPEINAPAAEGAARGRGSRTGRASRTSARRKRRAAAG